MVQCRSCGLVQLSNFPSAESVRPRVPWIRYNEPSAHLDDVATRLRNMVPQTTPSAVGVGPFDKPLLDRLASNGWNSSELDWNAHLPSAVGQYPYLESIQSLMHPGMAASLGMAQGAAGLVSCRYLLEHSHDPVAALRGVGELVAPGGGLLIEVPDSSKFLSRLDYSFIWEEHISYFTEPTLRACASHAGFAVVEFLRYPGQLEDAMLILLRARSELPGADANVQWEGVDTEIFRRYQSGFASAREQYSKRLQAIGETGAKVAIFGAGHQSIMFIQALGLQDHIDMAIDDDPVKLGYRIPGTSIPIVNSAQLESDHSVAVCLMGVNPAIEQKIRLKCAAYLNRGGMMYSIFPAAGSTTLIDPEM